MYGCLAIAGVATAAAMLADPIHIALPLTVAGGTVVTAAAAAGFRELKRIRAMETPVDVLINWGGSIADTGLAMEDLPDQASVLGSVHEIAKNSADRLYFAPSNAEFHSFTQGSRTFAVTRSVPNAVEGQAIKLDLWPIVTSVARPVIESRHDDYKELISICSAGNLGPTCVAIMADEAAQVGRLGVLLMSGHPGQHRRPSPALWEEYGPSLLHAYQLVILTDRGQGWTESRQNRIPEILTLMQGPGIAAFGDLDRFRGTEAGVYVTSQVYTLPIGKAQDVAARIQHDLEHIPFFDHQLRLEPPYRSVGIWVGNHRELQALDSALRASPFTKNLAFVAKAAAIDGVAGFILREVDKNHLVGTPWEGYPVEGLWKKYRPIESPPEEPVVAETAG